MYLQPPASGIAFISIQQTHGNLILLKKLMELGTGPRKDKSHENCSIDNNYLVFSGPVDFSF